MTGPGPLLALLLALLPRWGYGGHEMASRAAVEILPDDVPAFFHDAVDELVWLGVEPDRWRGRDRPALDEATQYDHYIDLELLAGEARGALDALDRFTFLRRLEEAGIERPESEVGLLPYRILELHQRLTLSWRRWLDAPRGSADRRWLETRIIQDAGLLGHYVADGSQPLHATIHFNGWAAGRANPEGFTTDRDLHSRFERFFVDEHVSFSDIRTRLPASADALGPVPTSQDAVRSTVRDHLARSFGLVPALYAIERDFGFDAEGRAAPEARDFAADRLADGAGTLALLWLSAWRSASR